MSAPSGGNPPLFLSPQLLTLDRHANARVRDNISMEFARNTGSILLTLTDIPQAAKNYPIVFTVNEPIIPLAIVGLERINYFATVEGKWLERCYVPLYIRKYPFLFMQDKENDKLMLCVDEATLVSGEQEKGHRLYEDSHPSAYANNALETCAVYQEQYQMTLQFCNEMKHHDMLSPQGLDVELANGRKIHLGGFQLINLDKFKTLSESVVFDWYKRGILEFSYYILQSHSNWGLLLDMASEREGRT